MKTMRKAEYNHAMDTSRLKLYMYDVVVDEHDIENSYYKIKCIGNEVHLYPVEKPVVEVRHWEDNKD